MERIQVATGTKKGKQMEEKIITRERNKELCKKYPWLIPKDWFEEIGKAPDLAGWNDPSGTCLDDFPEGWFIAFGEEMIGEIDKEIKKDSLKDFCIDQIKEKFGELRFYCHGDNENIGEIIEDYTALSRGICICCGKPDVRATTGWVVPVCYDCWARVCYQRRGEGEDIKEIRDSYLKQTEDSPMPNVRKWKSISTNGKEWVEHERDISEKAAQIRSRYKQRIGNDRETK